VLGELSSSRDAREELENRLGKRLQEEAGTGEGSVQIGRGRARWDLAGAARRSRRPRSCRDPGGDQRPTVRDDVTWTAIAAAAAAAARRRFAFRLAAADVARR